MGELRNERQARDLWVSRSHLWAMAAGTLVLAFTAFVLGFLVGSKTSPEMVDADLSPDNGSLVEVLSRVAAIRRTYGGREDLQYPDSLKGKLSPLPSVNPDGLGAEAVLRVPDAGVPAGDRPPEQPFTLRIEGLYDDEAAALQERESLRNRISDGSPQKAVWMLETRSNVSPNRRFQLFVGGFDDRGAANEAVKELGSSFQSVHKNFEVVENPSPSPRKVDPFPSSKDTDSSQVPTSTGGH